MLILILDFSSNVSVKFAAISEADRILYSGTLPSLQSFTVCYWVKIANMVDWATLLSYANSQSTNAFFIMLGKDIAAKIRINNVEMLV